MRNIGARIRALRAEQNISLPKLAEKSDISQGALSKLENSDKEKVNPSLETLQKLAEALQTTIADLIGSEIVINARVLPNSPPDWLKALTQALREEGKEPDKDILEALYVLQNRKGSLKNTIDDWKYLYRNIELNFIKRG